MSVKVCNPEGKIVRYRSGQPNHVLFTIASSLGNNAGEDRHDTEEELQSDDPVKRLQMQQRKHLCIETITKGVESVNSSLLQVLKHSNYVAYG